MLDGCGVRVRKAGILHLNREYVRGAAAVDVHALFLFVELRALARSKRREIAANLWRWRRQLARRVPPDIAPGPQCFDPYACPFTGHCISPPTRFSVRRLPRANNVIAQLDPWMPDDIRRLPADVSLSPHQERAIDCVRKGREFVSDGLAAELRDARHPIHFLDFETLAPAVPRYRRTRPYQVIPFQWSDHLAHRDGRLEHREYLHAADSDPRRAFAETLIAALRSSGTIVVYTAFENTQLEGLADAFRDLRTGIRAIQSRLFDLHRVVRDHYYHPSLDGSFPLKAIVRRLRQR